MISVGPFRRFAGHHRWAVGIMFVDLSEALEATPAIAADGSLLVRTKSALYRYR